jgi:hypothetical protein
MIIVPLQIVVEDGFLGFTINDHYCIFEIELVKTLVLGYHRI